MIKIVPSNQFKKDLKSAPKRGYDMEHLLNQTFLTPVQSADLSGQP